MQYLTLTGFPPLERDPGPLGATDGELFLEIPLTDGLPTSRRAGFCCCTGATDLRAAPAVGLGGSSVLLGLITLAGRLLHKMT